MNPLVIGFSFLPKTPVIVNGATLNCVFDSATYRDNKVLGGFEPDQEATIALLTSDLILPKELKGKQCTIDGETWRIVSVRYGEAICYLSLVSLDKV